MIPKIIHYCWFGHIPKPNIVRRCIKSWEKFCPDYQIIEWNENNFDVNMCQFTQEAYECKKWAFVSDYARLYIIFHNGGIYLDTDVELIKNIDDLLKYNCFLGTDGSGINTGLGFGATQNCTTIKIMMQEYDGPFITDGKMDLAPCTKKNTNYFEKHGFQVTNKIQVINNTTILPSEYLSPIVGSNSELRITLNTYSIHLSSRLWETGSVRRKAKLRLFFGIKNTNRIKEMLKRIRRIAQRKQ